MNEQNVLPIVATQSLMPDVGTWDHMLHVCDTLVKSKFLPTDINTKEKAAAVALKGHELNIPIMQSFSHIHIIKGKPTCSAELQLALLQRGGVTWEFTENTEETATIVFSRPGFKLYTSSFTMTEAKRAELLKNNVWKQYPAAMLRARAISAGARVIGPDLLGGMSYTPEELGATVNVETGEVVDTQAEVVDTKPAANVQRKKKEPLATDQRKIVICSKLGELFSDGALSAADCQNKTDELNKPVTEKRAAQLEQFIANLVKSQGDETKAEEQPAPEASNDPLATEHQRTELLQRAGVFAADGNLDEEKAQLIIDECDAEMYLTRYKRWMSLLDDILSEAEAQAEKKTQ